MAKTPLRKVQPDSYRFHSTVDIPKAVPDKSPAKHGLEKYNSEIAKSGQGLKDC